MLALVIPLGLLAALLYAISDFLEQRAASGAVRGGAAHRGARGGSRLVDGLGAVGATVRRLVHDRQWLAGWAVGTLGYLVQGAALHFGSIAVVQSLQVCTLLFALPLSTVGRPEQPRIGDWLFGATLCLGLALFLISRGAPPSADRADRPRLLVMFAFLACLVLLLTAAAILGRGPVRATVLALGAGICFAVSATLVKLTAADLTSVGVPGTARDWPGYSLALATGAGLVLQQAAFATGRLAPATTVMVVTNPLVGTAIAVVGFHESLPSTDIRLAGLALGGALITLGVAGLAHSPLLREPAAPEPAGRDPS